MSVAAFKQRLLLIVSLVILLAAMPLLTACGDDDDDDITATKATTAAPTTAAPTTAAPTTAAPTTAAPAGALLTIDSKLGELMGNPDAKAILEKHLPAEIMNSPRLMEVGVGLTIPQIAPASGGLITDAMLKAIAAELQQLKAYATAPATTIPAKTTSKLTGKPVKIGVLTAWSGPSGVSGLIGDQVLKVAEYVVEKRGGILGGRPVKFEKYDSQGEIGRAQAGMVKLASDSDVLAITIGGTSAGEFTAVQIASSELRIPLFIGSADAELPKYPYAVRSGNTPYPARASKVADYVLKNFHPKTAAYLGDNTTNERGTVERAKEILEAAGVKTVYEGYLGLGTTQTSPYLVRIKGSSPDVFIHFPTSISTIQAMYKQIAELGGWGDIKVIAITEGVQQVLKEKGAEGTYFWTGLLPNMPYAGTKVFEQAWQDVHGSAPNTIHARIYISVMSAIEAIDQAGTDREAIAKFIRSGKFGWDSPAGPLVYGTDGEPSTAGGLIAMIKDGKIVQAP